MTAPPIIDGGWFQALAITNRGSANLPSANELQGYSMEQLVFERQAAAESDMGHSRPKWAVHAMSALPPFATEPRTGWRSGSCQLLTHAP
jgi:hypothetical protein